MFYNITLYTTLMVPLAAALYEQMRVCLEMAALVVCCHYKYPNISIISPATLSNLNVHQLTHPSAGILSE
jgi:hypothetical protein